MRYLDKYDILEDGSIYSVPRVDRFGRKFGGYFMSQHKDKDGYPKVTLTVEGRTQKCFAVHKLVALFHVPNPHNYPMVNHKDGNKQNNHYSNLEWCTAQQNTQHAWAMGLCKPYDRKK